MLQEDWMLPLLCIETPQGVVAPGTLSPPLEGTMRQEGDGICSYQPPSGFWHLCITHPNANTQGCPWNWPWKHQQPSHPCVDPTYCQTKPIAGRHPSTFLSQGRWISAAILEQDHLLPNSSFTTLCFLLLRCCLGSSHTNLQPSALLIGVSIKNCPKICFSSALNVFAIKSRCGELKEQFSGLNKMT